MLCVQPIHPEILTIAQTQSTGFRATVPNSLPYSLHVVKRSVLRVFLGFCPVRFSSVVMLLSLLVGASTAGCGDWTMGHGSALCWSLVPIQSGTQLLYFRPREGFLLNNEQIIHTRTRSKTCRRVSERFGVTHLNFEWSILVSTFLLLSRIVLMEAAGNRTDLCAIISCTRLYRRIFRLHYRLGPESIYHA